MGYLHLRDLRFWFLALKPCIFQFLNYKPQLKFKILPIEFLKLLRAQNQLITTIKSIVNKISLLPVIVAAKLYFWNLSKCSNRMFEDNNFHCCQQYQLKASLGCFFSNKRCNFNIRRDINGSSLLKWHSINLLVCTFTSYFHYFCHPVLNYWFVQKLSK